MRPFEYTEVCIIVLLCGITKETSTTFLIVGDVKVVLKDEPDIDPNDQNSILEHLDKVVRRLHPFVLIFVLQ